MADVVNPQVMDDITATNVKVVGGGAAFYLNLAMADAVSHQRAVNQIREAVIFKGTKALLEVDPEEAVSVNKVMTGNDLAGQISQLTAALASIQQQVKTAQTTPPETGK